MPGAKTTLEVSSAKSPFSLEFAQDAQKRFENFHYQLGGDHALYYNLHLSEVLHTATSKPNASYMLLRVSGRAGLGSRERAHTLSEVVTLNASVARTSSRHESF